MFVVIYSHESHGKKELLDSINNTLGKIEKV